MVSVSRCPTCGADLHGSAICSRCGTLASFEIGLARARARAGSSFREFLQRVLPARIEARHFLWVCALVPFSFFPPLLSLAYAVFSLRGNRYSNAEKNGFEWLAIISLLNIIVSALALYSFHFAYSEMLVAFFQHLKNIFEFKFSPIQHAPPPKLLPV
jgi:hypothetical protein